MKVLSIRQPWAWFIFSNQPTIPGPKTMENRTWAKHYAEAQLRLCRPGDWLLIHAAKGMAKAEYTDALKFAASIRATNIPHFESLKFGGIVGMVKFLGAFRKSENPWFTGPIGLKFAEAYPVPFRICRGQLGFFEPEEFE